MVTGLLSARDNALLNSGSITSWSISITYSDAFKWSPATGLYTDAAATVPYNLSVATDTVYAKPAPGTSTYTATGLSESGCTNTKTVAITAGPLVTITTDYCYGGGKIQLTAVSTPAATSWLWNNGATTQSILVDLAGLYQVTAKSGACTGSAAASIAQELVVNGDFSSGNVGFSSAYGFVSPTVVNGMYPEGKYTVNEDPTFNHNMFFGRDHTSNTGKFMIVNGSGTPVNIWMQTMAVQPNTTYYFSAWAVSLNNAAPFAQLQFDVNGTAVGSTAVLAAGPTNNNPPYNWQRFYGNWTSGPTVTSATVSVKDLQTATGGNDFGLDDISFGTLSTFISHTSAIGSDSQTVCKNTAIIPNIYSVGSGAAGPTVTGLPAGVTSYFNGVSLTISGTPTTIGVYPFTIKTTGTCNPVTAYGRIIVSEDSVKLTSAAGTDAQQVCINAAITPITYQAGGLASTATVTGLAPGLVATNSGRTLTISGTVTTAGVFDYTVTTSGGCDPVSVTGSVIVRRQIITRSSPAGTNNQSVCNNTPITNITYALGGTATGATVTGLPAGVTGATSAGVFTISGTPTVAGSYSYTITTTGTCAAVTATGIITVTQQSITLTSAAATIAQQVCVGESITDITYSLGTYVTGVSVTGLPAGFTAVHNPGVFTISGAASGGGTFNFTVTTSGSCGTGATATGTITASTPAINLTSAAGTDAQIKCVNTAISNITYGISGLVTGATISGLPAGVTGVLSGSTFMISGTPTASGMFNYTITTTGSCAPAATVSGSIIVNQQTIALTSAAATASQVLCVNTAIANITYTVSANVTSAVATGLPPGVTGALSGGVFTISGAANTGGTFNYTITTSGSCAPAASISGSITVNQQTIALTSAAATASQVLCINTAITNIVYTVSSNVTSAVVSPLPAGVTGTLTGNTFRISGTPTSGGLFNYTVTTTGSCSPSATISGSITVNQQSITLSSAAGTAAQSACKNVAITPITYAVSSSVTSAVATGLPAGVTGALSGGVFTINGTPNVTGPFNYTITTSGSCAPAATISGSITVNQQTIALTSAAATASQVLCVNTAITNIVYTVSTNVTNAVATSLPAGVTGTLSGTTFTISGTPTAGGIFSYTITTSGSCAPAATISGSITVNKQTIALTSAVATASQVLCVNTAIANITYSVSNVTSAVATGLPTGVSGTLTGSTFTISGTPTAGGIYNYTITTSGSCAPAATISGSVTVNQQTIALTSAAATASQVLCVNTAITNITYTVSSNVTSAVATGLPAGVSGTLSGSTFTISGTPISGGTYNYTITTSGSCAPASTISGSITVNQQTIALTSAAATASQILCVNTAITNITYTVSSNVTSAVATPLPAGVTGVLSGSTFTISGTPTSGGTFNYMITTSGSCAPAATISGSITVNQQTIVLTSAAATASQVLCVNTAITNITYTVSSNVTSAVATGLPAGVTGTLSGSTFTISGTPTSGGTYNYTITTSGSCAPASTISGSVTVNQQTIALTSAAATASQILCVNTAITNITYTVSSNVTSAVATPLPAGVTGVLSGSTFTISGTPTSGGTYNYTITTSGSCAPAATISGSVTVNQQTIALTSAAATASQVLCVNTAITNITYTVSSNVTSAVAAGLPAGVTGTLSGTTFTISGTPTAGGIFSYSITTSGSCAPGATISGGITVNKQTIALSSAAATASQVLCVNTAITNITYTVSSNVTSAVAAGLPAGVTGTLSGTTFTISGTPTAGGLFSYTITTSGSCAPAATITGSITVNKQTIALSSAATTASQVLCVNTAITNITYTVSSNVTSAVATPLPAGVTGTLSGTTFTISGTPTAGGIFNYTITTSGSCAPAATISGSITVNKQTIALSSAAATASQVLCVNTAIANITYTVSSNVTSAVATGLPAGVTGALSGATFTISGAPTAGGLFSYTITTSGSCAPAASISGSITVNKQTIALSSAGTTASQVLCVNTAISNITYTVSSNVTSAIATPLPAGVTGTLSGTTFTISGTPTVGGLFNYTITTSGSCAPAATISGSITVNKQTIALSSAAATASQVLCVNTAITNITYTVSSNVTSAVATGLPAGVTGTLSGATFTISGTPTAGGLFNYTITTSGSCAPAATTSGSITVNQQTISLSSAPSTASQLACKNSPVTSIVYTVSSSVTAATVTPLPSGVTGTLVGNQFTISGTPATLGSFNYVITTTGNCGPSATASGSINVREQTIALSSAAATTSQSLCINNAITNITYTVGGSATGAGATGLPAGLTSSFSAGVLTISGTVTAAGSFNYSITTTGTCSPAAVATGSISVSPASAGGTIADASICYADNGSLSLTGHVGNVVRWEVSTDGSTWTNISNTTNAQTFSGLIRTTWYRALVQSGSCTTGAYSNIAKVGIHNLWTGNTSSDWNTGSNWSDGLTPTTSCPDVTIPLLTLPNVYPQLTSGTATVNNLIIYANATMQVSNATLQVAGSISNAGTLVASNGTIELNGTAAAQTIAGSIFDAHSIKNLVISNSNGVSFSNSNDTVKITGLLSFGTSNAVLNTNNNLTLISNATGTASVGDLTNGGANSGNDIIGNATVERYIPLHPKSWQFLATPTSGQSIHNAWQESGSPLTNDRPGYGSIITGHMPGAVALGFDIATPTGPSMKTYNPLSNAWEGVPSVTMGIVNPKGYMFFVRGDRSVTAYNQAATATTLRTTGRLFTTDAYAPASVSVLSGKFESVGNPYASSIDFRQVSKPAAPAVDDAFYVWDPLLTNNYYGLGGYQTITAANGWKPIPGGTANYDSARAYPYIQSGQAFFVHATGAGGTISFTESSKVNQSAPANRTADVTSSRQYLRLQLYNASSMLSDGNVLAFDEAFSNGYDANDALKIPNAGENIAIVRNSRQLALEARQPVAVTDTIFYTFNNIRRTAYHLKFNPENMAAGLEAKLVDKFLNTTTPISLTSTTMVDFGITTEAGSWATDRFYLVFKQVPPVLISSVDASRTSTSNDVVVNWTVQHESAVQGYAVQRSLTGSEFEDISLADPSGNNCSTSSYTMVDPTPSNGNNYYRIKGTKNDGQVFYSAIVKVIPGRKASATNSGRVTNEIAPHATTPASFTIFPNPVTDQHFNVVFANQAKGTYVLNLTDRLGKTIHRTSVEITNIKQAVNIQLSRAVATGNYDLTIIGPGNTTTVKQVLVQ